MNKKVDPVLNRIKEKTSEAYLYAITAKANYTVQKLDREYDDLGYDYQIANRVVGTPRTALSEAQEIKIQLKGVACSSKSMFEETESEIKYNLTSPILAVGPNCYLVVLHLLEDENIDQWIQVTTDQLILKKCAYFIKVPSPSMAPGVVTIPKTNTFDHENLKKMFISSKDKNEI